MSDITIAEPEAEVLPAPEPVDATDANPAAETDDHDGPDLSQADQMAEALSEARGAHRDALAKAGRLGTQLADARAELQTAEAELAEAAPDALDAGGRLLRKYDRLKEVADKARQRVSELTFAHEAAEHQAGIAGRLVATRAEAERGARVKAWGDHRIAVARRAEAAMETFAACVAELVGAGRELSALVDGEGRYHLDALRGQLDAFIHQSLDDLRGKSSTDVESAHYRKLAAKLWSGTELSGRLRLADLPRAA